MSAVLLDTHTWAWSLNGDPRLSEKAVHFIQQAETVLVSPISFFEIGQKVRLGKWPEMEPHIDRLAVLLIEQGGQTAPLDPKTCLLGATLDWAHRDPFDRLIAASAMASHLPLISADAVFDELSGRPDWVARIW